MLYTTAISIIQSFGPPQSLETHLDISRGSTQHRQPLALLRETQHLRWIRERIQRRRPRRRSCARRGTNLSSRERVHKRIEHGIRSQA